MTEKVTLVRAEGLGVPLIRLASPEELAAWYASQMLWALEHGERALEIACFDTAASQGFDTGEAARAVLRAAADVLYSHPEAESLTIRCGDDASARAYSFYWNMLYAEHKPEHGHRQER